MIPPNLQDPRFGVGESIEQTRADQARGLADIQKLIAGRHTIALAVQYTEDRDGMANNPHGPKRRIAKARCPQCGSHCEIHQAQNPSDGSWMPNEHERLTVFGWRVDGGLTFCGGHCAAAYGVQMQRHGGEPIPPVKRIADQSYAKTMYAETVPAAPPQANTPRPTSPKR